MEQDANCRLIDSFFRGVEDKYGIVMKENNRDFGYSKQYLDQIPVLH